MQTIEGFEFFPLVFDKGGKLEDRDAFDAFVNHAGAGPATDAVFIAHGPSFREGVVLPPIDNVDVYPLLMRLLGLAPEPNDGDAEATAGTLMSESGE